jgi:hypothetical protein
MRQLQESVQCYSKFEPSLSSSDSYVIRNPTTCESITGATRDEGTPFPMQILTNINDDMSCEVAFQDVTKRGTRDAKVTFAPPCFYSQCFRKNESEPFKIGLAILCVPVAPGKSRILLRPPFTPPKWLPSAVSHGLLNNFVDSDLWVHDLETFARGPGNAFYGRQLEREALASVSTAGGVGLKTAVKTLTSDTDDDREGGEEKGDREEQATSIKQAERLFFGQKAQAAASRYDKGKKHAT